MREYIKKLISPFNIVVGFIVIIGLYFIILRFSRGLAAITSASDVQPWGLTLALGLFSVVPLSASGYVLGSAVYLFRLREYYPVVKNAILIGFLGYFFAVVFLLIDLGRPWRIYYPMFVSYGPASVMFLVAWHVALYLSCQALEFSPSAFEWLGLKTFRKRVLKINIGLTIFGVILSTLHQSALGAMFLLMPGKLHPLWYTTYIPWLFFISSIAAGLSMVIFISWLTKLFFKRRADSNYIKSIDNITLGLGKAASFVLITYFALKWIGLAQGHNWNLLVTSWGLWFLCEILVFVLLPCILFLIGSRDKNLGLIRFTSILTIIGIIINRLNVSLIAFNWNLPHRELLHWRELIVVISVFTFAILVYRWIVNRMPVLHEHPDYK
ncbi:MAG: polysulfide reductase NrfD [Candidatus Aminicenantes bacterium]|nr:MAG: polysulfide reductase NrfD [Candidatus Aminicenantes bacterium]